MQLVVLGCWGGFPPPGGATSGYLVETGTGRILVDCGSGVLSQLGDHVPVFEIDAVVLSHLHHDHVADVGVLQYAIRSAVRRGLRSEVPVPLFVPENTPGTFTDRLAPEFESRRVQSGHSYQTVGANLRFYSTGHPIECNAVRIEAEGKTLVYSGDSVFDLGLQEIARQADLFLCESTNIPGSRHSSGKGHMGPGDAGTIAAAAKVRQLVLTHLPSDGNLERAYALAREKYSGFIQLASEQTVYTL